MTRAHSLNMVHLQMERGNLPDLLAGMTRAHSLNMVHLQMQRGNLPYFCPRPKCPPSANPPHEEGRLAGFSLSRV